MRDDNEFTYYDYYGYPQQVNKFNRLLLNLLDLSYRITLQGCILEVSRVLKKCWKWQWFIEMPF